jgi:hypothetical protein
MKKHIYGPEGLVKVPATNPKQLGEGNACGLRAGGIESVVCVDERAHFRTRRARSQSRLQERGFSRRRRSAEFREAAARQTTCGFVEKRNSRGHGRNWLGVGLAKWSCNPSGKSGLDVETQGGGFRVHGIGAK